MKDLAVAHLSADPDSVGSAYTYGTHRGMEIFIPQTSIPSALMVIDMLSLKSGGSAPVGPLRLHLLDFHSKRSLHPSLHPFPIDTIIDHHLDGDLVAENKTIIDPVGATSTLVGEIILGGGEDLTYEDAIALGFGICDDTAGLVLHATDRDSAIMERVKQVSGKDIRWFMEKLRQAYMEGFKVDADTRTYTIGNYTINIGQFRAPGALSEEKVMREVSQYVWSLGGDMDLYIVSDPGSMKSIIVGKVNNEKLAPLLGKVVGIHPLLSRKVDVLPLLKKMIEEREGSESP